MRPNAESSHATKGLVRLTMACNERCGFCNVPVEDYLPSPTPSDKALARQLEAFVASGARTLTLSGGEPTLRRTRLIHTIAWARSQGVPFVDLQTNAVLIDRDYADALAEAGLTSAFVSLLCDREDLHDQLVVLPGAFAQCLSGIDALIDVGISVTLNPVFARLTQDRVARYVDFVAARFPKIRSISMSAVQPHGRAARDRSLMPDYDRLAPQITAAQARGAHHGITLLNPYCGLPACVGWAGHLDRSVEAQPDADPFGIHNHGDKRHGPPCRRCPVRTRCAGAWHAYWDQRSGAGLAPVEIMAMDGPATPLQARIVAPPGGPDTDTWAALATATAPTVWLHTTDLQVDDVLRVRSSRCTDLALTHALDTRRIVAVVRRLARAQRDRGPQRAQRIWLDLCAASATEAWHGLVLAHAMSLHRVRIPPRHDRLIPEAHRRLPGLDVVAAAAVPSPTA